FMHLEPRPGPDRTPILWTTSFGSVNCGGRRPPNGLRPVREHFATGVIGVRSVPVGNFGNGTKIGSSHSSLRLAADVGRGRAAAVPARNSVSHRGHLYLHDGPDAVAW